MANVPALALSDPRLLAITPAERPDLGLARALSKLKVPVSLDIGRNPDIWQALFDSLESDPGDYGLRIAEGLSALPTKLPRSVSFLIVAGDGSSLPASWSVLPWLAQVTAVAEAERALAAGAAGLIAKGQECGGQVGDESSFVLLQRLLALTAARPGQAIPVWCQGGIGLNTAAGAIAGGAAGVVIDSLLAAYPESALPHALKARLRAMDGSETRTVASQQFFASDRQETTALGDADAGSMRAHLDAAAREPAPSLYPIGQDAALLRLVVAECPNLESLIQTLRSRVVSQIRQAQKLRVMDQNNPWARDHGTRYPIAQGPMTRVSDTAEFAAQVAEAGGLPFLALSLMQAEPSRALLAQAREQAGDKPWGVGVLGFAPAEILDPQLELVREFRPSALLLAGGRPSQARPFIEAGIPTYLHAPSPGLLELFIREGMTHFVLEGRECGGHVGPRYSFVLWEQALALLTRADRPERFHVLFAGGIHDERSSAMVATIAAPLAARGARVGVLMGTAYIATREVVSAGAVLPEFQDKALSGAATTLIETAPGHAVRCLPSGFVELFEQEKARLRDAGTPTKEAWISLEAMTVGRLRLATKGLDYVNGVLKPIAPARQDAEGMYMIGQAIALRQSTTSIPVLHAQVTTGATQFLDDVQMPVIEKPAVPEPVAIIGMGCVYAGSPDLETFWTHILEGRDLVREVPADRWSVERYWQSGAAADGKTPSKWGGFIEQTPFDPLEYGIPPQSLRAIEPAQLLSLQVAKQALADAGYAERWFDRERTAVIFGAEAPMDLGGQYAFRNLYPQYCGELPEHLQEQLPALTEDSFAGVLGNVISGRIANRLGLGGVNYAVDAACASSLTAIELAVRELRSGSSELVIAGGADFHNGISDFLMFASLGALSPTGRSRAFDDDADGIAMGEGIGVLVLKRQSDAERDGDRIYAVINSVAGSSDGRAMGLTAPRKEGQKRALARAYAQAGLMPGDVGLVEAHGTGTVVGDRTELETLTEIFTDGGSLPGGVRLGSVKSQIGHTKCAAGIAGVIKVAKALHHRVMPATQLITRPNAAYSAEHSPFRLDRQPGPWLDKNSRVARAAVSAFGFGGTNFHAILSEHASPTPATGAQEFPAELFAIRGETADAAARLLERLGRFLSASSAPLRLRDLAHTAWESGQGPVQLAFVARDRNELIGKIQAALQQTKDASLHRRPALDAGAKIAVLFSGQGSQYPGMLRELFVYFRGWMEPFLQQGVDLLPLIYPATAYEAAAGDRQRRQLAETRHAQPALGLVEFAAFAWLEKLGLHPDMAAGHSYGELAALATAGAFDLPALLRISRDRAAAMTSTVGAETGLMAAVRLDAASLAPLLSAHPGVVIANHNGPIQSVISGPAEEIRAVCATLASQSIGCKLLDTDRAFHSPMMQAAGGQFADALAGHEIAATRWPVYSNVSAAPHGDAVAVRDNLARHLTSPVRFSEEIERLYADGARVFVEIGPQRVLTGLAGRILGEQPHHALALDGARGGLVGLLDAAAQLAVLLPHFDAAPLFAGRAATLDLDSPSKLSSTTWMVDGGQSCPLLAPPPGPLSVRTLPKPASATPERFAAVLPARAAGTAVSAEQTVLSYLDNMRELVRAQRDVMLGYLGAAIPASISGHPASARPAAAAVVEAEFSTAVVVPIRGMVEDLGGMLLQIVAERTGYPPHSLELDLDLEADLSIDSIKRLEIVGELSQRLDLRVRLGAGADELLEQLSAQRSLRAMQASLSERLSSLAAPPEALPAEHLPPSALLLEVVSQCTGYPLRALELDLDLEADLSIDSIKRLEIIGQLTARLGLIGLSGGDSIVEQLSSLKTLRAMLDWLEPFSGPAVPLVPGLAAPVIEAVTTLQQLARYVFREYAAPATQALDSDFKGLRFLLSGDVRAVAPHLLPLLEGRGASVHLAEGQAVIAAAQPVAGVVHLCSFSSADQQFDEIKRFFSFLRPLLAQGLRYLIVAGARSAPHEGGFAGLLKTLAKEYPGLQVSWIGLETGQPPAEFARQIERELVSANPLPEVQYQGGRRLSRELVVESFADLDSKALALDADSVVLLTGGARGVTAHVAITLARRYRCTLELVGRSDAPAAAESPVTKGIEDHRALRQALMAADPASRPAEVEARLRRLLANREIARTLDQVRAAGGRARYSCVDVRDETRFSAFIAQLYQEHGRIDGVIHGAGTIEDKLARDKTDESFERVFDTKVSGALTLDRCIRDDVKFVVFFSSVASVFGNRGQSDYAAANDVLDKLASRWQNRIEGRAVSINWGPWADAGMVSDSLRDHYRSKGIGLIPLDLGIEALLDELSVDKGGSQVVLMCGQPESFDGRSLA